MAADKTIAIDLGITRNEYNDATRPQRAELVLETGKHYNGGISSEAKVYWVGEHFRSHKYVLFGTGGDFSTELLVTPKKTATQKAIDTQHAEVFTPEKVAELTERAKVYYSNLTEAAA